MNPMDSRIVVIVPVGALEGAKSRLGEALDAEERSDLVARMAAGTVAAAVGARGVAETLVVTPDEMVRQIATRSGGRPIRQRGEGLNAGLRQARDDALAGGADAIVIVPIDLPLVSSAAIEALLEPLEHPDRPLVIIVPDRHGRGTNALVVAPPGAIEPSFGGDSLAAHRALALEAGARIVEIDGPLTLDLDTPDDLLLVEQLPPAVADGR
jgi:2-phospho-L-lactate/phosphoenolpyruvate guanylyltransferase